MDLMNPVAQIRGSWPRSAAVFARLPDDSGFEAILPARLRGAVERLREAFERITIDRLDAVTRSPGYDEVGPLAHGLDQARFLGRVLDPGAVVLGIEGELGGPDLDRGVGRGLERIADHHRDFVSHVLGGTGRDEEKHRIARLAAWRGL